MTLSDSFTALDYAFMQRAITLAERGLYTTSPNPRVGCVLVSGKTVIGEGFHFRAGEGHAEVNAIADARAHNHAIKGATAYVTLEPCSHTGRTPPCCNALIDVGVTRVVVAMQDPNPLVAGSGIGCLRAAGITVEVGILAQEAEALNPGFIKRMRLGLPWLRAKLAMSLDGRTAMASGESQWITGPEARREVQRLRAQSSAIISGVDTVVVDQASLTVRPEELGLADDWAATICERQPLRVVLDSQLRLPLDSKLLSLPGRVVIATALNSEHPAWQTMAAKGIECLTLANAEGRVDLVALMHWLAGQQCNDVLLEAGSTLAGAFLEAQLIDHLTVFMAPTLLGSLARPLFTLPLQTMAQQQRLNIQSLSKVGDDFRIDALPIYGSDNDKEN